MYRTKGTMIKELKANGIRKADKDGATVGLEHLKYFQVVNLYYDNIVNKFYYSLSFLIILLYYLYKNMHIE